MQVALFITPVICNFFPDKLHALENVICIVGRSPS